MKNAIIAASVAVSVKANADVQAQMAAAMKKAMASVKAGSADVQAAAAAAYSGMNKMGKDAVVAMMKQVEEKSKNLSDAEIAGMWSAPKNAIDGAEKLLEAAKKAEVDAAEIEKLSKKIELMKAMFKSMPAAEKKIDVLGKAMIKETNDKIDAMDATKLTDLVAKVDCSAMKRVMGSAEEAACKVSKTGEAEARAGLKGLWGKGVLKTRACLNRKIMDGLNAGKNAYADEAALMGTLKTCVADLANVFTPEEFPVELFKATAPTTAAVAEAEKKAVAAAKKSGAAFLVASGATLAALALF